MAWMAAIGGVVASAFGATAISAGMAAVVGGIVVGAAAGGGGAGSNAGVWGLGGLVGNLGAGYLNGLQATKDREADLAMQEKRFELENKGIDAQLIAAEMGATTSRENALTAAETAANQLEFAKDKFGKEFAEDTRRYNQERDDATKLRDDFRSSVVAGSQYASGAMPTIKPVEIKRQRMQLPQPSWITGNTQNQAQQTAQQPTPQPAQPQQPTGLLNQQQQVPA